MSYAEWCPTCYADVVTATRGIPSMGTCRNGHTFDRRDALRRKPDPDDEITAQLAAAEAESFQSRVNDWIQACFGAEIGADKTERNHRFLEEALELVQAAGCSKVEAHKLVDYVFSRDIGELHQEVGGVMNTLAAFCTAHGLDMSECGERELFRVWTKVEAIREKQRGKPKLSPLPQGEDWHEADKLAAMERVREAAAMEFDGWDNVPVQMTYDEARCRLRALDLDALAEGGM